MSANMPQATPRILPPFVFQHISQKLRQVSPFTTLQSLLPMVTPCSTRCSAYILLGSGHVRGCCYCYCFNKASN